MSRESEEAWSEIEEKEGWGGRVSPLSPEIGPISHRVIMIICPRLLPPPVLSVRTGLSLLKLHEVKHEKKFT